MSKKKELTKGLLAGLVLTMLAAGSLESFARRHFAAHRGILTPESLLEQIEREEAAITGLEAAMHRTQRHLDSVRRQALARLERETGLSADSEELLMRVWSLPEVTEARTEFKAASAIFIQARQKVSRTEERMNAVEELALARAELDFAQKSLNTILAQARQKAARKAKADVLHPEVIAAASREPVVRRARARFHEAAWHLINLQRIAEGIDSVMPESSEQHLTGRGRSGVRRQDG